LFFELNVYRFQSQFFKLTISHILLTYMKNSVIKLFHQIRELIEFRGSTYITRKYETIISRNVEKLLPSTFIPPDLTHPSALEALYPEAHAQVPMRGSVSILTTCPLV